MARAKRTVRSEARRRYRAQLAAQARADQDDDAGEAEEAPGNGGRGARTTGPTPQRQAPAPQGGVRYAFRESIRPLDVRGDLAYLPRLLRHRSVLAPVGVSVASTALLFASAPDLTPDGNGSSAGALGFLAVFLFQYFVVAPPVGSAFLAGFLAPKASWLAGGIAGLVAVACLATLVYSPRFSELLDAQTGQDAFVTQALIYSPVGSAVFASAAAWYRRFLSLINPNRGRPPARQGRSATPARASARRR